MSMTAADLDSGQKRGLLDHIKSTVGEENYRIAVKQVGEDGLIDAFIQHAEKNKSSKGGGSDTGKGGWFVAIVAFICQNGYILIPILGWPGAVLWGAGWLIFLAVWIMENPEQFGVAVASILGIGILAGVGFGLWTLSPWMIAGIKGWFDWLGSHF